MISAEKAKHISDTAAIRLYNKELRKISFWIKLAAKRGASQVEVYDIQDDVKEKLESYGYVVDDDGDRWDGSAIFKAYKIKWG